MEQPKILIGTCIRQTPVILEMYLRSLSQLEHDFAEIAFVFVDDNIDERSTELLSSFGPEHGFDVTVIPGHYKQGASSYLRSENTHIWDTKSIWKVAEYKNEIIRRAVVNEYDALFLVDSDLLLQRNTLHHLWGANKDIISEIFWTRWQPNTRLMPQVWQSDEYTLYSYDGVERLTPEMKNERMEHFLNILTVPGIYEVGGLGALTLIRKEVLHAGVNFTRLKNVSFWGEDRHFCIRAAAHNFGLFVDTHLPAYHIYRDADLEGARKFCEQHYIPDNPPPNIHND